MPKILGSHIPAELNNLAINGNFDFWQRVEATTTTINTSANQNAYTADMWAYFSGGASTHNYSIAQAANTTLTESQSGFQSSLVYSFTRITGLASFAASDYTAPTCLRVEGYDYAKIHGKKATFGFWIQASVAGTYSFVVQNGAQTRNYATTFVVNGSNTWQFVSISVVMEVPTTNYVFTTGLGMQVLIGAVAGSTFSTSTTNTWQAGQIFAVTGATNWMATNGATMQIAQFSIVEGPLGFGATGFSRQGKTIQQEFALCQRYYEKSYDQGTAPGSITSNGQFDSVNQTGGSLIGTFIYKVPKRSAATVHAYSPLTGTIDKVSDNSVAGDLTSTYSASGQVSVVYTASGGTSNGSHKAHWISDAGL